MCGPRLRAEEGALTAEGPLTLVVGLGNPGPEYAATRHNVGFRCVAVLARRHRLGFSHRLAHSRVAEGTIGQHRVVLARPHTFMNRSGDAVAGLLRHYRLDPAHLLVVHDDLDLPLGRLRLRPEGSAGGHQGLRSIIERLRTAAVPRLRLGIGRPGEDATRRGQEAVVDYVLASFRPDELPVLEEMVERAADAVTCLLEEGMAAAMNRFN